MIRGRLTPWLFGTALLVAGCVGAPKGEGGEGFTHRTASSGRRSTRDSTRRNIDSGYRSMPDFGPARGQKFEDIIPIGARITAVNVATDDGVRAIWLSYERNGVVSDTPRRGGDGGFTEVFELAGDEKIVDMDAAGRHGIDRLTVATDKRVKTFGNDGSSANPSSWITDEQKRQYLGVGIAGRADDKLRQFSLRLQVRQ